MKFCGVDEAGKGSVLGPMTAGGVLVNDLSELDNLGIKDSKQLTPKKRESIFDELTGSFKTYAVIRSPLEIDTRDCTMNRFTAACHAEVLKNLLPDTAYIDACDVNAERFAENVSALSGLNIKIISEHKADDKYKIVGAASIIAKVTRDRKIEELKSDFGEIGSGYPSDPLTISFLTDYIKEHGEIPCCARKSWQTVDDIIAKLSQKNLADFF
ncbi:MAG: ribonuclease HII [Methanocorpusculum sp.]|nr:ribonuclease HII [Methanocorpusculum sp.]